MAVPHGWDAPTAVASCPIIGWSDPAWRAHNRKYDATDPGGSLKVSGRYKRSCEGILIPSATRFPDPILVIFPDYLRADSQIQVIDQIDPVLYVPPSS